MKSNWIQLMVGKWWFDTPREKVKCESIYQLVMKVLRTYERRKKT